MYDQIVTLISNVGFPIAVSIYLKEEIKNFMQTILDKQESFDVKNPLSKIASANIVGKTVKPLFNNENKNKEDVKA